METFETTDPQDAKRCRYAQFGGMPKTVTISGSTVTGMVRSVMEDASCTPTKWTIKIAAT